MGAGFDHCPGLHPETAPVSIRGRLGSLHQLIIVLGIFVALLSDSFLPHRGRRVQESVVRISGPGAGCSLLAVPAVGRTAAKHAAGLRDPGQLVVSRARSSGYVLGMGHSDTCGRDSQRECETHGRPPGPRRQLAELEWCLRRCARSGW